MYAYRYIVERQVPALYYMQENEKVYLLLDVLYMLPVSPCMTLLWLVGNGGMDPYSSP